MALITDKPEDLRPVNDLDDVHDPDLDEDGTSIDRYVGFGTTPKAITNPPAVDEIVEYRVKVIGRGDSRKRRTDGEMRYRSEVEILSVARAGQDLPPDYVPPPSAAQVAREKKAQEQAEQDAAAAVAHAETEENQPTMFDDNGEPTDPDAMDGERVPVPGDDDEEDQDATPVDRPAFSDATI